MDSPKQTPQQHGREELFAQLLLKHQHQIFRLIFCMVHHLEDTRDLFQEASAQMWKSFGDFEIGTDFVAWASAIARNKALNLLTSRNRKSFIFSSSFIEELAQLDESDAEIHQQARLDALASCRQKLSSKDQELLRNCYSNKNTIREAAKQIGRSPGSVYHSLIRVRSMLFDCIRLALVKE